MYYIEVDRKDNLNMDMVKYSNMSILNILVSKYRILK